MEASFLVPMATILTGVLILLLFYVHNQVWYTCAACEAAIVGNGYYADDSGEEKAVARARQRIQEQTLPGNVPDVSVSCDSSGSSISYSGQQEGLRNPFFLNAFSISASETVRKIRPVSLLYLKYAAGQLQR